MKCCSGSSKKIHNKRIPFICEENLQCIFHCIEGLRIWKFSFYQYVFNVLSVEMLYADVWEGNTNSIKSLEFYGYKLIETRKERFAKTGEYAIKYIYALSKNDL